MILNIPNGIVLGVTVIITGVMCRRFQSIHNAISIFWQATTLLGAILLWVLPTTQAGLFAGTYLMVREPMLRKPGFLLIRGAVYLSWLCERALRSSHCKYRWLYQESGHGSVVYYRRQCRKCRGPQVLLTFSTSTLHERLYCNGSMLRLRNYSSISTLVPECQGEQATRCLGRGRQARPSVRGFLQHCTREGY